MNFAFSAFIDLGDLFAHRPAQDIGIAQGVTGQDIGDFHNLFLVDDDPVGLLQHGFDVRQGVVGGLAAVLGLDEIVDHPGIERAGTIEGDQGDKIAELFRGEFHQQLAHARTLQLKDPLGVAPAEEVEGFGIVHGDGIDIEIGADILLDMLQGLVDDGKRLEAEKIEFDQSGHLGMLHVVLGQGLVVAAPAGRQVLGHRAGRHDHSGGMGRGMTGQSFQGFRDGKEFGDARVLVGRFLQFRLFGHGLFDGHFELFGDQLGDLVHLAVGDIECPADIADDPAGLHRTVGDDLGDMFGAAVFLAHIFNDFAAPFLAEINIEVRHRFALDIEKTLKDQAVGDGDRYW